MTSHALLTRMLQHFSLIYLIQKFVLVIRLRRTGRKKQTTYSVVVAEKARAVKGKFLEKVGSFNPTVNPKEFTYDLDRITHWVKNGAKPSDTLASLLKRDGVKDMDKFIGTRDKKRKRTKELPEKAEAPAAAPEASAEEPKEEAKEEAAPEVTEALAEEMAEEPAKEEEVKEGE